MENTSQTKTIQSTKHPLWASNGGGGVLVALIVIMMMSMIMMSLLRQIKQHQLEFKITKEQTLVESKRFVVC